MRILVIEDEAEIASFIKKGLETASFAVDTAANGETGLKLALENPYDVIVIDIMLPGKDGIETCSHLREKKKEEAKIIMLTAKGDLETKMRAFSAGADDYLTKPFAFEELLARVRALLRRSERLTGDILKVDDMTLNAVTREVARANKKIELNKKEFALLEYFMRHPGIVLTRTMILEHVWDMNADPFTNTVDVHIRFLREKIEKGFRRKLIHTVHGFGYKME